LKWTDRYAPFSRPNGAPNEKGLQRAKKMEIEQQMICRAVEE
jgi:hypothetical protein